MAAHLRRAGLALVLVLAACSSSSAHAATPALGQGSWSGARTTREPKVVLITFVGAAPYRRGDPCTARYRAAADETARTVRVRITATAGKGGASACNAIGYPRSVRLRLARPLGDRTLVEAAFDRTQPVFAGSRLLRPSWLPRRYRLQYESGYDGVWTRHWRLPIRHDAATSNRCLPSRPGLALTEGPAAAVDGWGMGGLTTVGTRNVRGTTGPLYRGSSDLALRLVWHEGSRGFSLATVAGCVDDRPITEAQLLRVANGLRPRS